MFGNNRRLKALLYLIVLFPLWWLQRTQANPVSPLFLATSDGGDGGGGDHDGDDDDGDRDDDDDGDDDDGGEITDCNGNGIDDAIDIANGTSRDDFHDGIPDECQSKIVPYCRGTGAQDGGVDCPCGNTLPPGSTTGCANRTGSGASLTGSGDASVSNDTVVLLATGLPPGVPGFFFQGDASSSPTVFGNGIRCIAQFVRLRKIVHSTGGDIYPVPGGPPISVEFNIPAGATKWYQVMYRDAGGPCGATVNATNGLMIIWGL